MSGPVEAAAWAVLERRLDSRSNAPLAVAVSGGGDSVALLHCVHGWAEQAGRPMLVLTVDHGLQPGSAAWADFVAREAEALGLACRRLTWTGPKPSAGLPATAREARHALLAEAARAAGARVLVLGHTADDRAEADWMRARGTAIGRLRDWSPSPAWPEGRGLMLLRPLLDLRRAELRAWLGARRASWLEDPANTDPRFARARARAALTEASAETERPIDPDFRETGAAALFSDAPGAPGALAVGRAALMAHGGAHAALGIALLCAAGRTRAPRGQALAALLARLASDEVVTATLAGARLQADAAQLVFGRDLGRAPPEELAVAAGETVVWDGRFEVPADGAGRMRPAAGHLSRLTASDRRRLCAAPPWVRRTLPVLERENGRFVLPPVRALALERLRLALDPPATERELAENGQRPA